MAGWGLTKARPFLTEIGAEPSGLGDMAWAVRSTCNGACQIRNLSVKAGPRSLCKRALALDCPCPWLSPFAMRAKRHNKKGVAAWYSQGASSCVLAAWDIFLLSP